MSNESSKRPQTAALRALANTAPPALLPIRPDSALDEIIAQMHGAEATTVELLVPAGTRALESVAGCDALRQAAEEAGIHVLLFTADEQTIAAARLARLDTVLVGSSVQAPQPSPTRSVEQHAPPPRPQAARPVVPQPPRAVPPQRNDANFLTGLAEFEQSMQPPPAQGRLVHSDEGAMLYDVSGDAGVPRPASDDAAWNQAFGAMDEAMAADPDLAADAELVAPPPRRRRPPADAPIDARAASFEERLQRVGTVRRGAAPDDDELVAKGQEEDDAQPMPRRRRNPVFWPLALLGLLALGAGGWLALRRFGPGLRAPTIQLAPPPNATNARQLSAVIPLTTQPVTSTNSVAVYGRLITLDTPVAATVQGTAEKGAKTPIGLATGTITLRNTQSQPVEIPEGTPVEANGVVFRFDRSVVVPAATVNADGVAFGRKQASLTAATPGAQGNVAAGTITRVPGALFASIRVEQDAFAGGTDQEVKIVRVEDVNRVLPQAMSQLYTTGVQALQLRTAEQSGWNLPAATITPTIDVLKQLQGVDYTVLPPIGSVAPEDGSFTVEVRARFQAIAEPSAADAKFDQQLAQAVKNQVVNTNGVDPRSTVTVRSYSVRDQTLVADASVQPPDVAPQFAPDFLDKVKADVAGKSRAEAEQYFQQLVSEKQLARLPDLPQNLETIPANVRLVPAP